MLIKICGLTHPSEAEYLNRNQVDYAGMVLFFPKSKRNITIDTAKKIMTDLNASIKTVAVVVSPTVEQANALQEAGFDYLQIHGTLPKGLFDSITIPVLKAFNLMDLDQYPYYHSLPGIAGYVFDALEPGSGKTYDLSLLQTIPRDEKLFLLAGGLNASNVKEAISYLHPDGVDVSSGVEYTDRPGKDGAKIDQFVQNAKMPEH